MPDFLWHRSLYVRVALGFVTLLAGLMAAQTLIVVWLAGQTGGTLQAGSETRLAALVASDIRDELERNPGVDVRAHVMREYARTAQPFLVLLEDGRAFSSHGVMPQGLLRTARLRLARMREGRDSGNRGPLPDRELPADRPDFAPILVHDELAGLVAVPAGRAPLLGVVRAMGPALALSGVGLLAAGTVAAALLVFGPIRRRLREMGTAASRIGAGEMSARVPEGDGDEVTVLAKQFNRMAADLQARAEALAASDRARRQLLSDVSHELMTPLTAMRGYIETLMMAERRLDPDTRERYLQIVNTETRQVENIVGDLLDLARFEDAGLVLEREPVSVGWLFDRVAARHERELRERRINLPRQLDPPGVQVHGDRDRLEQVLQNLTANALRHTPDGGAVTLSGRAADGAVRLTVRDTGPGIAAHHLPLLFDRFFKADAARASGGTGLGLSIVKAIVHAHGGTIAVRNDGGAVFEIDLPA